VNETKNAAGVAEDFDLLEFIDSGTIARREVVIYTDHEAAARCHEIAAEPDAGPEESLGETTSDAEAAEWLERLMASKMTWTVRALSSDEIERAMDEVKPPAMPVPPNNNAPRQVHEQWAEQVREYNVAKAKADADRRLVLISYAVLGVETARGTLAAVDVDTLRGLRAKPHGQGWIDKLYAAVDEASSEDVEPPVPTSPGRSTSTRG
jgi:hypothetical protein